MLAQLLDMRRKERIEMARNPLGRRVLNPLLCFPQWNDFRSSVQENLVYQQAQGFLDHSLRADGGHAAMVDRTLPQEAGAAFHWNAHHP